MIQRGISGVGIIVFTCVLLLTPAAWAQQNSGIAGAVRDTSQAVLPGVTVEAASPALIEKVRTVVTDGQGRYNIVALPPGTYTVTFTLPGFSVVRREDIVLTAGFTATVNADMAVGSLEETITVTGESPLVDTQNVRTQTVVSSDLIDTLPTATRSFVMFHKLTPGMIGGAGDDRANSDVGGSAGPFWANSNSNSSYHGRSGIQQYFDGMRINDPGGTTTAYVTNNSAAEEMAMETSGFSAESPSTGVTMNVIPKSGGNTFAVTASSLFSNSSMQSDNLSDTLRARGVEAVNELQHVYTGTVTVGGPIKRDRLWFFTAPRWDRTKTLIGNSHFNLTQGTPFFTPDLTRRTPRAEKWRSTPVRVTWQASQKDKVNIFADYEPFCGCFRGTDIAAEESTLRTGDNRLVQVTWMRPVTNRLLLEAGGMWMNHNQILPLVHPNFGPNVTVNDISIRDVLLHEEPYGANRALGTSGYGDKVSHRFFQRYSVAYVTGTHAFKAGVQFDQASRTELNLIKQDISYDFRGSSPGAATPLSLTLYATPYTTTAKQKADLGLFVQDQWRVKRLTLNLGLRFDWINIYVPEQHAPAGRYIGARDFAAVRDVPNWKDLNPRLGVAYDLFGNGRTALKASLSRYVVAIGTTFANAFNPLVTSVNTVNRDWNDSNGNYVPDCDLLNPAANGECGRYQNLNYGGRRITTRWTDDVIEGFNVRDGFWGFTTEVQHQLTREASLVVGYYHNWDFNARVTDNLLVAPEDYSPFSVTAPVDARLSGGGGYTVSGLYDLAPAKVGQVDNLVRHASDFGQKTTQTSDFFAVSFNTRFGPDIRLGGGIDTGRSVADNCFVVDSPQQLLHCRVVTSFKDQTQAKLFASYPLPGGFVISTIFNNIAGVPVLANYTVTRAQVQGLGRPLSTSSRNVPLIAPNMQFEQRHTNLDVQLSNTIQLGRFRVKPSLGVYNALNSSATLLHNNTYGPDWRPLAVLSGRLFQVSTELSF